MTEEPFDNAQDKLVEKLAKQYFEARNHPCKWNQAAPFVQESYIDEITSLIPIIQADTRQEILAAVDGELWKIRQMFDYDGNPTDDESKCTLSNLMISSQRWAEFKQSLKGEK